MFRRQSSTDRDVGAYEITSLFVECPKCGASHEVDPKENRRNRLMQCPSCGGDLFTFVSIPIRLVLAIALSIVAAVVAAAIWLR